MAYGLTKSLTLSAASSQYAFDATTSGLWSGSSAFTLEAWVKTTVSSEVGVVGHGNQNTNNGVHMAVDVNKVVLRIEGGNAVWTATGVNDGSYHHIAITFSGGGSISGRVLAYMDGSSLTEASLSDGTPNVTLNSKIRIGANLDATPANYFTGQISLARLWNEARSQSSIATNKCSVLGSTTNLGAEYTLDDVYTDNSGNANTLTSSGSPTFASDVPNTCTASGPTNLKSLDTNLKANIKSYNTNLIANVKSINTNA